MSLLAGVLLFGGVTYYVRSQAGTAAQMLTAAEAQQLKYVGYAIWSVAVLGSLIVKLRFGARIERGDYTIAMIGWSLAEAAALFGGVYYWLGGDYSLWLAGVIAMLVSFSLFPIPRDG